MNKRALIVSLLATLLSPTAVAQSAAALLFRPWTPEMPFEAEGGVQIQAEGQTDAPGSQDIHLSQYVGYGRYRLDATDPWAPAGSLAVHHIDLDTDDARLPGHLTDASVAGLWSTRLNDDWRLALVAGVGVASDEPFEESEGLYALGDVMLSRQLSEASELIFTLNYNGNRSIFPDVPLPTVAYSNRANPQLVYVVGLPMSNVRWTPADRWTVSAYYVLPFTFGGRVEYELVEQVSLFGRFGSDTSAFDLADDDDHDRLLFSQRILEAGIEWRPCANVDLVLAGGYAFDQEFEYGWDVRDADTVTDVSSEAFGRVAASIRF